MREIEPSLRSSQGIYITTAEIKPYVLKVPSNHDL